MDAAHRSASASESDDRDATPEDVDPVYALDRSDDAIVTTYTPGWLLWAPHIVIGLVAIIGGIVVGSSDAVLGGITFGGALLGYAHYAHGQSEYVVTDRRVLASVGVWQKSTGEARLDDIEGIETDESGLERLLGRGTVRLTGEDVALELTSVSAPEDVAATIRQQRDGDGDPDTATEPADESVLEFDGEDADDGSGNGEADDAGNADDTDDTDDTDETEPVTN